jgi:hypothetical protein
LPPLLQFLEQKPFVEHNAEGTELYLYHGTNCYRRWEINRSGNIEPGRSGYTFYTADAADAYSYARAACLRDTGRGAANSLLAEPVVLKVRFSARTWIQADFVQEMPVWPYQDHQELSVAVLGPVPCANIVEVLHCCHGRKFTAGTLAVRTFADGTFHHGIQRLRGKTCHFRLDAFLLLRLGSLWRKLLVWLRGRQALEVTTADELRRLCQVPCRR